MGKGAAAITRAGDGLVMNVEADRASDFLFGALDLDQTCDPPGPVVVIAVAFISKSIELPACALYTLSNSLKNGRGVSPEKCAKQLITG
jgi:hypothetical protein